MKEINFQYIFIYYNSARTFQNSTIYFQYRNIFFFPYFNHINNFIRIILMHIYIFLLLEGFLLSKVTLARSAMYFWQAGNDAFIDEN